MSATTSETGRGLPTDEGFTAMSEHPYPDDFWQNDLTLGQVLHRGRLRLMVLREAGDADKAALRVVINDVLQDIDAVMDALGSLDEMCSPKFGLLDWLIGEGCRQYQNRTSPQIADAGGAR